MQKFSGVAQDTAGNAQGSVQVQVYLAGTLNPAIIFSDQAFTVKANPFTNSANGVFWFYGANGVYDIVLTKSGYEFDDDETSDVILYDPDSVLGFSVTGTVNNWDPPFGTKMCTIQIGASGGPATITGLIAGRNGQIVRLVNAGPDQITLTNEGVGSTADNRFLNFQTASTILGVYAAAQPDAAATYMYDTNIMRWKQVGR